MKTQAILLSLLISFSQVYAWGDREQSALLGFVGGVITASAYHQSYGLHAPRLQHHPMIDARHQRAHGHIIIAGRPGHHQRPHHRYMHRDRPGKIHYGDPHRR